MSPVLADSSDTVEITAVGFVTEEGVDPPSNFSATFISPKQVNLTWTKGVGANATMVRAKFYEYPENKDDGYLVYYGTGESTNDTALDLDVTFGPIYYIALSENETE